MRSVCVVIVVIPAQAFCYCWQAGLLLLIVGNINVGEMRKSVLKISVNVIVFKIQVLLHYFGDWLNTDRIHGFNKAQLESQNADTTVSVRY